MLDRSPAAVPLASAAAASAAASGKWTIALKAGAAALVGASSAGTATWYAYNMLLAQAQTARGLIGKLSPHPPEADGLYCPGGDAPLPWHKGRMADYHLMIFGDSTAAGLGALAADEVPGVRLARGLAEESGKTVRLSTKAICGASSEGLRSQVNAALLVEKAPDAAVILIGANDVTHRRSLRTAAADLRDAVRRLRAGGAAVVVGTCPDLGVVTAIPQPLRAVARQRGLRLARAQAQVTLQEGGHPVALADLLAPEFLAAPDRMFSTDQFHPSAAGYELAARQILPVLCTALGVWAGGPLQELPHVSAVAQAHRPSARLLATANRVWFRARNPQPALDAAEDVAHPFGRDATAQLARTVEAQHRHQANAPH